MSRLPWMYLALSQVTRIVPSVPLSTVNAAVLMCTGPPTRVPGRGCGLPGG